MDGPVLVDFDGVYPAQDFYRADGCRWLFRRFLRGAGACCAPQARRLISRRIGKIPGPAICFSGSGNYHYVCLFFLSRIRQDFSLVLFDHHSDAQPPAFGRLLSCGSWVGEALRSLPHLRQVIWVGATAGGVRTLPCRQNWVAVPESAAADAGLCGVARCPVYVSVDKDVFGRQTACTNWDQGRLDMARFAQVFGRLTAARPLLGMDVCGELPERYGSLAEFRAASRLNSRANRELLALWRQAACRTLPPA